ncbi:homoserine kinase [Oscillospiraceae bacterium OttesenSCG-928-G22]|nr:homoserine kinase [Oscillospiraceae bacterium OttesenSCG-928-G22]
MIRISVPATSANMGPGFDTMGIALSIRNVVEMDFCDRLEITNKYGLDVHNDERNLIYRCAKQFFDILGKPLPGLRIIEECNIPMTRGLGSSSACTVAGLLGANELLGKPLSQQDLINLAAVIEGHPDNSTPAIRGGFVAALLENGKVWQVRVPISERLKFCVFVPKFTLKTEKARGVLPTLVPHKDAVFTLARAALLAGSLVTGELENIGVATDDLLHQPYRFDLIPQGREVVAEAKRLGALGSYISGSGPTIIAIVDSVDLGYHDRALARFSEVLPEWRPIMLTCDEVGATVEHV